MDGNTRKCSNRSLSRPWLCWLAAMASSLASAGEVQAEVFTVCSSGCDETLIQAAIDSAIPGDTIRVTAASPHLEANIEVDKSLVIEGIDEATTIVEGDLSPGGGVGPVFTVLGTSTEVTFRDLTIRNGHNMDSEGGGIRIPPRPGNPRVVRLERITLMHNRARFGGGLYNAGELVLDDVDIISNEADFLGGGLYCQGSTTTGRDVLFDSNAAAQFGGGIAKGGAANGTDGVMTLDNVRLEFNRAEIGGGAIENRGDLRIQGSSFVEENSSRSGAGLYQSTSGHGQIRDSFFRNNEALILSIPGSVRGGGIYAGGPLDIRDTRIASNSAQEGRGGGIYVQGGAPFLADRIAVERNDASTGGGLYRENGLATAIEVANSSFTDNTAVLFGGGIVVERYSLSATNVTISGNRALGSRGGAGIYVTFSEGDVGLSQVTITRNQSPNAPSGGVSFGPGNLPAVDLRSSIIAGNTGFPLSLHPDCDVEFSSGSYSLIGVTGSGASQCGVSGAFSGMLFNTSAQLAASDSVGGRIYVPLLPTSPAIDSGICIDAFGDPLLYDQIGASVPTDGNADGVFECDMGAVEHLPEPGLASSLGLSVLGLAWCRRRARRFD